VRKQEAGCRIPSRWVMGEKGKNYKTLHETLLLKKHKEAGAIEKEVATRIEGHRK